MRLGSLGPTELILIVLVLVLIFGASKIGDIGGALGKSVKEFKKATKDGEEAEAANATTTTAAQTPMPVASATVPAEPAAAARPVGDFRPPDAKPS